MCSDPSHPGETQFELVQRRGRESEERYQAHLAAIEEHRRNGTLRQTPSGNVNGGLSEPLAYWRT